jgi:hypothetical protein
MDPQSFFSNINCIEDVDLTEDELIDLRTKSLEFNSESLGKFWCSLREAYTHLVKRAMEALIPFATTYLCESGFPTLAAMKTKNQNRLHVQHDMRVALSNTTLKFNVLGQDKQQQSSYGHVFNK